MSAPTDRTSIIRASDSTAVPWKNGMGTTRQIAIQTSMLTQDDFQWRVSVAEVDSDAPFSSFPDVDRHIVLLDGAGFRMTLDDHRTHWLDTPFVPFAFPGEASVAVALIDGATRDFNLMVRRAEARGDVVALRQPGIHALDPTTVLVYIAQGTVGTRDGTLQAGDAWRVAGCASACAITLHQASVALLVRVQPHG